MSRSSRSSSSPKSSRGWGYRRVPEASGAPGAPRAPGPPGDGGMKEFKKLLEPQKLCPRFSRSPGRWGVSKISRSFHNSFSSSPPQKPTPPFFPPRSKKLTFLPLKHNAAVIVRGSFYCGLRQYGQRPGHSQLAFSIRLLSYLGPIRSLGHH